MLNIYYGRENADKEAFGFEMIKAGASGDYEGIVVLVPDQVKLLTESRAMEVLNPEGIMGLEILSIRRLGMKILKETGGVRAPYIDKTGRSILLSDILAERAKDLKVYGRMGYRANFVAMLNNQISELKRFGAGPEALLELAEGGDEGKVPELLKAKLQDIALIYGEYEKRLAGKYVDTEDRTNLFLERMGAGTFADGKTFWIWGFDWLAPKDLDVIGRLMEIADVNIVFTWDRGGRDSHIFEITGDMMRRLEEAAEGRGITHRTMSIGDAIEAAGVSADAVFRAAPAAVAALEKGIFEIPSGPGAPEARRDAAAGSVKLVAASSEQGEAESAAAYILWLLREQGYRYRDIAVICNDMEERGERIKHVFEEYGLPLFLDTKRNVLQNPAVTFLLSLVNIVSDGYRTEDIFSMLKTGYGPLDTDSSERLENYALSYKVTGSAWKKPFTKAADAAWLAELPEMEAMRQQVAEFIGSFEKEYKADRAADARTEAIYGFLRGKAQLPGRLKQRIGELEAAGAGERAAETAQIWKAMLEVLAQMKEVMGSEKLSLDRYRTILEAGIASVQEGILPPGPDCLTMGTMQRSRIGHVRAVLVLGACEGQLPKSGSDTGLLSEEDKKRISAGGTQAVKLRSLRAKEENLAIYRMLAAPSERLYMSYSAADASGEKMRPSEIFSEISRILDIKPDPDILAEIPEDPERAALGKIHAPGSSLRHLARAAADARKSGRPLPPAWQEVYTWLADHSPEKLAPAMAGAARRGGACSIAPELASRIYKSTAGALRVSPSTLEKYSKCPFSFFVQEGLAPSERRYYEMASREVGDIYHLCFEKVMEELSADGLPVYSEASLWQTISREACDARAEAVFDAAAADYRNGLAGSGPEEKYRAHRMKEVLKENLWALIMHARLGRIESVSAEQRFAPDERAAFPAIEMNTAKGAAIITGKIDRVDVLKDGEVKIIDYKTGENEVSPEEIREGWRIQLMLYLKAAKGNAQPAGVFYYVIHTPLEDESGKNIAALKAGLEAEIEKFTLAKRNAYAMKGLLVSDTEIIRSVAGAAVPNSTKNSAGTKVVKSCNYSSTSGWNGKALISREDFEQLEADFDKVIKGLCENIIGGDISILPKKTLKTNSSNEHQTGCDYCPYHSICGFDQQIPGFNYHWIDC